MALLAGEKFSQVIRIDRLADVAGRQIFVNLGPHNFDWTTCLSTGYDVKFTLADGTTVIPHFRLCWVHPGFAQFMLKLPADITENPLIQWGDAEATDTSSFANVYSLPNPADCDAIYCWPMNDAGGAGVAFVDGVAGGVNLTNQGTTSRRDLADMWFGRRKDRMGVMSGPTLAGSGNLGFYTLADGYYAASGVCATPPVNGSIHLGFWQDGKYGTIFELWNDANNYLRLEYITGNLFRLTKTAAGVTTTKTTAPFINYARVALLSVQWGSNGLEFLIAGIQSFREPADTAAWGAGAGTFTLGARHDGSDHIDTSMIMTCTIHNRRLTWGEIGHKCYHMRPPLGLSTIADKLRYAGIVNDASAAWEGGVTQEFTYLGKIGSTHHAIYHGGSGSGNNYVGHMTSLDRVTWTRDPNNPILGNGTNGEAGETMAVNGGRFGDAFYITYNNTNTNSDLKIVTVNDTFDSFSAPQTLLEKRTDDWPLGIANTHLVLCGTQMLMAVEGVGVSPGSYTTGVARGPNILSLALDASTISGATRTTGSPSISLQYGGGQGGTESSGGPFIWVDPLSGLQHWWIHGGPMWGAAIYGVTYHRTTWDGTNFYESPNDIVVAPMSEVVAEANSISDPCVDDAGGLGPTILWAEMCNDPEAEFKIVAFMYGGNLSQLVADSPRAEVGASGPWVWSGNGSALSRSMLLLY